MDTMTKRITDARFKRSVAGRTTNYADGFRDGYDQALADRAKVDAKKSAFIDEYCGHKYGCPAPNGGCVCGLDSALAGIHALATEPEKFIRKVDAAKDACLEGYRLAIMYENSTNERKRLLAALDAAMKEAGQCSDSGKI